MRRGRQEPSLVATGALARYAAHAHQSAHFVRHRVRERATTPGKSIGELYLIALAHAFSPEKRFIVTGAPHARAFYPRNFAWFYPDLLEPSSLMGSADARRRRALLARSATLVCRALRARKETTTLVPVGKRLVGVNYFFEPSDSLLGLLAALRQLSGRREGRALVERYRDDIAKAVLRLAGELEQVTVGGATALLCDASKRRSGATAARAERMRFVTNASVWTTLSWAVELRIVARADIERRLGMTLGAYKKMLLELFGSRGYVRHSLERSSRRAAEQVSLDFVHVKDGFWDLRDPRERRLFADTADLVLSSPKFRTRKGLLLMSLKNPRRKLLHRMTASAYQGRSAWPCYNVEFADRLLDIAPYAGERYAQRARELLLLVREAVERIGGYPELLSERDELYRTWAYRAAIAHAWFPRFASVWNRAFPKDPLLA
jgi:hypothetical protein